MGVRFPSVASNLFVGPLPANATETVVCTTPPLNISLDFAQVFLHWFFRLNIGAGTTSLTFRIRRGVGTGGASISGGTWDQVVTAGTSSVSSGSYIDTPGAVAGQQYSLTCAQNAATAAGTAQDVALLALAL